jgi:hypothetical protein
VGSWFERTSHLGAVSGMSVQGPSVGELWCSQIRDFIMVLLMRLE